MKFLFFLFLSVNAFAETAISTKDVDLQCDYNPEIVFGYFKSYTYPVSPTQRVEFLARIGDQQPHSSGVDIGRASITKLNKNTYKIVTDLMILEPWGMSDYWDKLTMIFNLETKVLSYVLESGYTTEVVAQNQRTCKFLDFGDKLKEIIKTL